MDPRGRPIVLEPTELEQLLAAERRRGREGFMLALIVGWAIGYWCAVLVTILNS